MFEIIFLGTSASAPSINRGLSANLIIYKEHRFLIDCGEGTQRQILQSGLGFRKLDKILLTHGHLDHILGLGGLASTFSRWEAIDHIEIFAGKFALQRVKTLIENVVLGNANPPIRIDYCPLTDAPILENATFKLQPFPVSHRGPGCYGFLFEEKPRRPFNPQKAATLNLPIGPLRKKLVEGQAVTLDNGRVIQPDDVLDSEIPGVKLAFMADVGKTEGLQKVVKNADAMVIESTYLDIDADMAKRFGHITATQAANLAKEANVKKLILTHVSRRYRERDILSEAQAIFPNTAVARDFDHYIVTKDDTQLN